MSFEFFKLIGFFVDLAVERNGFSYEVFEYFIGHWSQCDFGFSFLAFAPAHLLRRLRDAEALHPIFSATVSAPGVLSPAFLDVLRHPPMTYEIL